MEKIGRILAVDAETNGLWGEPIAFGAALLDARGKVIELSGARLAKLPDKLDPFVREHVAPALERSDGPALSLASDVGALYAFMRSILKYQLLPGTLVVADVPYPVDARFLERCVAQVYPLIDVASMMLALGHDPDLAREDFVAASLKGQVAVKHNPAWDAYVTGLAAARCLAEAKLL